MENSTYEQEIDLKNLMFAVFRKWRLILLFAIAFAILLGGYKCIKELIHQNDEGYIRELKELYETDNEEYEQSKNGYKRDIDSFTASIKYQEKYKENSILLKIDPYNKGTASVDIFVKMAESSEENGITVTSVDFADGVVKAYASAVQQGEFLDKVSKDMGIDLIYLKELINVTTDYDSNMLNVSVTYTEKEGAGEILDEIVGNLKSMYPDIQDHLGQHRLSIMNQDIGVITDQTLADYQKQKVEDLATTHKNLEDAEKELKELEKPNKPIALSSMSIVKAGVKYGIVGGFLGAFLVAFVVCAGFLLSGKINNNEDLKNRFGLIHLGSFKEIRKKKVFSVIDNWLDILEGKEMIPDDLVCDLTATNIYGMLEKEQSIFLTGMVEETRMADFAGEIQQRLSELKIDFGTDILHNAKSLQNLQLFDAVILVEVRGQSKMREIEKELETVLNMKKKVLGYIVMDSVHTSASSMRS